MKRDTGIIIQNGNLRIELQKDANAEMVSKIIGTVAREGQETGCVCPRPGTSPPVGQSRFRAKINSYMLKSEL